MRGAWIEISPTLLLASTAWKSLPVRGAWIEMGLSVAIIAALWVAPRAGSVD